MDATWLQITMAASKQVTVELLNQDRDLLQRFRDGQEDAVRQVFRHYAPGVARSIRQGVRVMRGTQMFTFRGPAEEVEVQRLVQETFSRAFSPRARLAYDGVGPFAGYLRRIARNLMVDEARRAPVGMLTATGELPEEVSADSNALQLAEDLELTRAVRTFVEQQPAVVQSIFQARFAEHLSQQDAASRLGLARITVRRAETRLKTGLLEFLAAMGLGPRAGGPP